MKIAGDVPNSDFHLYLICFLPLEIGKIEYNILGATVFVHFSKGNCTVFYCWKRVLNEVLPFAVKNLK